MKKEEIKNIMVLYNDNDFVKVWDWIGKVSLMTILNDNFCGGKVLEESDDIERFILSLLPTAIEFLQYREDRYADFCRYENISETEVDRLSKYLSNIKFKYNFDETDEDYIFGGSEILIIDLHKKESYIK